MRFPRSVLLVAALSCLPSAALATPSGKDRAEAVKLINDAKKASKDNKWAEAVKALQKARELDPNPQTDLDLAKALASDGKLIEAAKVARGVADSPSKDVYKPMREAAKKLLGEIEPRVPFLKVTVTGPTDKKPTVRIDGAEADVTMEVAIDPGEHEIAVEAEGYLPASTKVKVAEGKHEEAKIELKPKVVQASAPPEKGSLIPGIVVTGVGGVGLLLGGVFGGLAFSAASAAKKQCTGNVCPESAQGDIDRSKTFGNVSTAMFVIGGVAAAGGVVLLILRPFGGKKADEAPKSATVRPWIGIGQAGLNGSF
jgi:hypothetical protein